MYTWFQNAIEERQCKNRSTKEKPTIKNARHLFFFKTPFLKIRLKIKFWLIFECPMKIQVLFLLIPFKDKIILISILGFLNASITKRKKIES